MALRRIDPVLVVILLMAAALRLHLAASEPYLHDEENTAIPLAETISFDAGRMNLPLRGENHGALPAYVVHASRALFGTSRLETRALHGLFGLGTIVLIYLLVRSWYGPVAARWAAALMAFNEFYLEVSSRATAHVPHLFLVTLAIFAFARFLATERPRYLYGAGVSLGLAFYCKEHSALLLPVFLLMLLPAGRRQWLRTPHPYAALAVFALLVGPDLLWNARTFGEETLVNYSGQTVRQADYTSHLRRIGGLGLSPYPSMFYGRSAVIPVHRAVTGRSLTDETPEYDAMNPALGVLLVGAVAVTTARAAGRVAPTTFFLVLFWFVFCFFTFIKKGNPPGRLDPVSWIWVEVTLIPAVMLAGHQLARAKGIGRVAAWTLAVAALVYAVAMPMRGVLDDVFPELVEGLSQVSHDVQLFAEETVATVRLRPLRALAVAVGAGAAIGVLAGFGCGWIARGRRAAR